MRSSAQRRTCSCSPWIKSSRSTLNSLRRTENAPAILANLITHWQNVQGWILFYETAHKPPIAPITKASIISPFPITESVAGKHRSPFARLRLVTFELRCPPVLVACSSPSFPAVNITLWYSERLGSQLISSPNTAFTLGSPYGASLPLEKCSDGNTKRWDVTSADAGFPGKLNISLLVSVPELSLRDKVAKVVGFPGFMETRPKWIVPPRDRSIVGLRRSSSPIETPPDVTMTSTLRKAPRRCSSREPGLGTLERAESVGKIHLLVSGDTKIYHLKTPASNSCH